MSSNPQDELRNLLVYNVNHIKVLSEGTFAPFTIKMKNEKKKNEKERNANERDKFPHWVSFYHWTLILLRCFSSAFLF